MLKFSCLGFYLFCGLGLYAAQLQVDVDAKAGVLMNAKTGAILWEKRAHEPMYPASTTKVFTAVLAYERKGHCLNERIVASREAMAIVPSHIRRNPANKHPPYRLEFGGTHMWLTAGEEIPFRSLLEGLMLVSGNDAANVIAEYVSGSIEKFVEELNQFIKEKGCLNTVLYTPHGLPHPDHKTTAYDLAVIGREYLRHPTLREISSSYRILRPKTNKQAEITMVQHNALLRPGRFFYPKAHGVKIGYTDAAGHSIVAAAEEGDRELILVFLEAKNKDQRYQDVINVFEAAFKEQAVERILFPNGVDLFTHLYEGSKQPVQATLGQAATIRYYPSEEPVLKTKLVWDPIRFPVLVGTPVGRMEIWEENRSCLASFPLVATKQIEADWSYRLSSRLKTFKGPMAMAGLGLLLVGGASYFAFRKRR